MSAINIFKLENGDSKPISIDEGKTVIGRGPFLQVTDKRVSRNHGVLEVSDGKLYITPTHTNPCFFKRTPKSSVEIMKKDERRHLENGQIFGLLPDSLYFKVQCPVTENGTPKSEDDDEEDWEAEEDYKPKKRSPAKRATPKAKPKPKPRARKKAMSSEEEDLDSEEEVKPKKGRTVGRKARGHGGDEVPSTSSRASRAARAKRKSYVDDFVDFSDEEAVPSTQEKDDDSDFVAEEIINEESASDWEEDAKSGSQKRKRKHAGRPSRGKGRPRRKKKNMSSDEEEEEMSVEESSSDDYVAPKRDPKTKKRKDGEEKNPEHFTEFSHPGDVSYDEHSDLDDDDIPDCPYGHTCFSFINDRSQTQKTDEPDEGSEDDEDDEDEEEDIDELKKEAKKFIKNDKLTTP
ncbi:APLF-like protein, partial [Mya arenaria]